MSSFCLLINCRAAKSENGENCSLRDDEKRDAVAGSDLFSLFRYVELRQQMRARGDANQMQLIHSIRNHGPLSRQVLDTLRRNQLSARPLPAEEVDSWREAAVLVLQNAERHAYNDMIIRHVARSLGSMRITWHRQVATLPQGVADSVMYHANLNQLAPGARGIFVQGARVLLIDININVPCGITNGMMGEMVGIGYTSRSSAHVTSAVRKIRDAEARGDVGAHVHLTAEEAPHFILVKPLPHPRIQLPPGQEYIILKCNEGKETNFRDHENHKVTLKTDSLALGYSFVVDKVGRVGCLIYLGVCCILVLTPRLLSISLTSGARTDYPSRLCAAKPPPPRQVDEHPVQVLCRDDPLPHD